jgi:predicted nucleic acid-binding protein
VILVDSSVWIAVLSKRPPFRIDDLVDVNEVVTCLPIVQEVLQGVDDDYRFEDTRDLLYDLRAIDDPMTGELFHEAILLFREARKKGVTVRSSVDCLIAASAIRHGATVPHRDRDFDHLARVTPLKSLRVLSP